jgi:hypothetical protein
MSDWKDRLRQYDGIYSNMYNHIFLCVKALTDEELNQLQLDLKELSQTNCSWTLYAVRPIVQEIAMWESQERAKTKEAKP